MNLVVLGAPGVGKGTYTGIMAEMFGLVHISTGDMFRENIKNNTTIGKAAKENIDKGLLVPDGITVEMLRERLAKDDCKNGFILDGFPRTINQANLLKKITHIDKVLNFVADDEVIIQRLSGRRVCKKCAATCHVINIPPKEEGKCDKCGGELYQREDDKEEVIKERLKEYREKTAPLNDYYHKILFDVDVNSSFDKRGEVIEGVRKLLFG